MAVVEKGGQSAKTFKGSGRPLVNYFGMALQFTPLLKALCWQTFQSDAAVARHSARPVMNLGGLAPEVARAQQQSIHGLERMRLQQQSELVQQKARQQRHRLEQESVKLRTDIRDHKFVARERAFETGQATRVERELIR